MVVHIEAPLRCSFWLERQTTLHSRKRLGIFREAANTSPERIGNLVEQSWLHSAKVEGRTSPGSSYLHLTTVSSERGRIARDLLVRSDKKLNESGRRRPKLTSLWYQGILVP